ncbi:pyridoxamine 5'-phosphate oxidase family protein [Gordonia sp. ABSL1-1]|uniref:pyridoxamine 5'-phosphate oxidase family protein n=1 Tax=Gordonia sp. ABSL1-1 TaxID=3053923 RepID=UPI00257379DF|nr:pyridoxamine 5'-phosphate oxidase family protein [Gordonia sp. ABSL1-1]MDL9936810.1 pyridoxamine 5'-phosphate oxidase family protein [Gordonia sp. ABSL1-1]
MEITSAEQLRAIVGEPVDLVIKKVKSHLYDVHREWLASTPMMFLATADGRGGVDVSPKGDPAGALVHVIDDTRIAIPERPGNKRVDGYLNILAHPHVGTVFIVPGRGDTLRINGSARIVDDGDYFDDLAVKGKRPILAVEIDIEQVFFHCAKAFMRSELWKPESWPDDDLPSTAQIAKRLMPEADEQALEERYAEANYRKILY